jgi:hypothetical protein
MCSCLSGGRRMQQNKRFEQSPDANISICGNPAFHVFVWPLRARLPLGTAQLKRSVMLTNWSCGYRLLTARPPSMGVGYPVHARCDSTAANVHVSNRI